MEKITKEQMFRSVSDLSSGIAHGMKEIAKGNASFVGIVKNTADELNINLDVLSDKFGKDDKGVMKVVNAFRGVSIMGKNADDTSVYCSPDVYTSIAETILLLREKVFMEYYD